MTDMKWWNTPENKKIYDSKHIWKIPISDARLAMEHIGVCNEYIEVLLEPYSDVHKYVIQPKKKYFSIVYDPLDKFFNGWGWLQDESDYDEYVDKGFKPMGLVNLRKEKLKKIINATSKRR